jgi:tripartite-type tricarboxylate transporter receptor subunit TctC
MLKLFRSIACLCALIGFNASADDYPSRPIKIIVGYVAGGGPDMIARVLATNLAQTIGQPVIVENKPGAGGVLATGMVAKLPADGYTLLLGETGQLLIAPFVNKSVSYHTLTDFTPVAKITTDPMLLVASSRSSIRSMEDLIRQAKARPGTISYGSSGIGTIHNITMEAFKASMGLDIVHIPYKGSGQSITAALSGEIPLLMTSITAAGAHIRNGSLRILATTSAAPLPGYPDVPSFARYIPGFDFSSEVGILAPAGLPPSILAKLTGSIKKAVERPEFKAQLKNTSIAVTYSTPAGYAENLRVNMKKFEQAVKSANIGSR